MKTKIQTALKRLNAWTRIAFNDPHASERIKTSLSWPPAA